MKTPVQKPEILILSIFATLFFLASPVTAQEVLEIHFDNVPAVTCNEVWIQDGLPCHVTETTAEDCDGGGSCFFDTFDGLGLFPARLVVDLGSPALIYRVEVDFTDYCGIGCSQAFLYNAGTLLTSDTNDTVGEEEVLLLDMGPEGAMATDLAVSSCEGFVSPSTIRIYSEEPVATEQTTWDLLKATYR